MRKYFSNEKIKYLTQEEFKKFINAIKIHDSSSKYYHRNLAIFLIAEYCGLRASEIGLITLEDIDFKCKTIFCRRLKGSVSNDLLIKDEQVLAVLKIYYEERLKLKSNSKSLFLSKNNKPLDRRTLHTLMKFYSSFTNINLEKTHFHTLKHTCAMRLLDIEKADIRDVQWWLGHKYITNTMIYLNYSISARKDLYNKLTANRHFDI